MQIVLVALLTFLSWIVYADPSETVATSRVECTNCKTNPAEKLAEQGKEIADKAQGKCEPISVLSLKCYQGDQKTYIGRLINGQQNCFGAAGVGLLKGIYQGMVGVLVGLPTLALMPVDASLNTQMGKTISDKLEKVETKVSTKTKEVLIKSQLAVLDSKTSEQFQNFSKNIWQKLGATDAEISESARKVASIRSDLLAQMQADVKSPQGKIFLETLENPEKNPALFAAILDQISGAMTDTFGCQKWKEGHIPFGPTSICEKKWESLSCANCQSLNSIVCGSIVYLNGMIIRAPALLGAMLRRFNQIVTPAGKIVARSADEVQNKVSALTGGAVVSANEVSYAKSMFEWYESTLTASLGSLKTGLDATKDSIRQIASQLKLDKFLGAGAVTEWAVRQWTGVVRLSENSFYRAYGKRAAELKALQTQTAADIQSIKDKIVLLQEDLDRPFTKASENRKKLAELNLKKAKNELKKQEEKYAKLVTDSEVSVLNERVTSFAETELGKIPIDKWKAMSPAEKAAEKAKAIQMGLEDQAKNFVTAVKYANWKKGNPGLSAEAEVEEFASIGHKVYQIGRKFEDPKLGTEKWLRDTEQNLAKLSMPERKYFEKVAADYKEGRFLQNNPRVHPTEHRAPFVARDDGTMPEAIDIANTPFEKLPNFWRADNVKQASNMQMAAKSLPNFEKAIDTSKVFEALKGVDLDNPQHLSQISKILAEKYPKGFPTDDPIVRAAALELNNFIQRSGFSTGNLYGASQVGQIVVDEYGRTIIPDKINESNKAKSASPATSLPDRPD
jgi:hypothetical protein